MTEFNKIDKHLGMIFQNELLAQLTQEQKYDAYQSYHKHLEKLIEPDNCLYLLGLAQHLEVSKSELYNHIVKRTGGSDSTFLTSDL